MSLRAVFQPFAATHGLTDCLEFRLAYNHTSNFALDLAEAILQVTADIRPSDLSGHLELYREAIGRGQRVVAVGHSQGNLYINQAFPILYTGSDGHSPLGERSFGVVAVATPASYVADQPPSGRPGSDHWTTFWQDFITLVPGSLPGDVPSSTDPTDPCVNDMVFCHSFRGVYLFNPESRMKILADTTAVIASLKRPPQSQTLFEIVGPINGAQGIGPNSSKVEVGQSITNSDIKRGSVTTVEVTLGKFGAPTDDIIVSVRNFNSINSELGYGTVHAKDLPDYTQQMDTVQITLNHPVSSADINFVILRRTGGLDPNNFPVLFHNDARNSINIYPGGTYIENGSCSCPLDTTGQPAYDVPLRLLGVPQ